MCYGYSNIAYSPNIEANSRLYIADNTYKVGGSFNQAMIYDSRNLASLTYLEMSAQYVHDENPKEDFNNILNNNQNKNQNNIDFEVKIGEEIDFIRKITRDVSARGVANVFYKMNFDPTNTGIDKNYSQHAVGAEVAGGLAICAGNSLVDIDINATGYRSLDKKEIHPMSYDCINLGNGWGIAPKATVAFKTPVGLDFKASVFAYGNKDEKIKPALEVGARFTLP